MSLPDLLKLKRSVILSRWRRMIRETYPPDAASFIEQQKDRFHNPVGHTISEATAAVFDAVLARRPAREVASALDGVVRVRAVQEFSAAQAVAFVFQLKRAIREEIGEEISTRELWTGLSSVEGSIDQVALTAFDLYMQCRERVFDVRVNELKRRMSRPMQMLGRVFSHEDQGAEPAGCNEPGKEEP